MWPWYTARACLDTGNGGCTLIVRDLAIRLGLVNGFGNPIGGGRVRWVDVRGVVAGASEKIPIVSLCYRIKVGCCRRLVSDLEIIL